MTDCLSFELDRLYEQPPSYVAVSAVYGGLTWAEESILPALLLHAGGDVVVLARWWLTGRPEWQREADAPVHIQQSGVDAAFVVAAIAVVVLVAATAAALLWVRGGPAGQGQARRCSLVNSRCNRVGIRFDGGRLNHERKPSPDRRAPTSTPPEETEQVARENRSGACRRARSARSEG